MIKETSLLLNNTQYRIIIIRSLRKSISLELVDINHLKVKAPTFTPLNSIKNFIYSRKNWIIERNNSLKHNLIELKDGAFIPLLEKSIMVQVNSNIKRTRYTNNTLQIPKSKNLIDEVEKWYIKQARELIEKEVKRYSEIMNLSYNRVFIKSQKTRWGSCSSKGNLNFNWKIILTTRDCLNYLIIHELAHLREMNHSLSFWRVVRKYDSNYTQNRLKLKSYSSLLNPNVFILNN